MHICCENLTAKSRGTARPSVWKQAVTSVFGAAVRLHRYRDARDALLRRVLQEQERSARNRAGCDE